MIIKNIPLGVFSLKERSYQKSTNVESAQEIVMSKTTNLNKIDDSYKNYTSQNLLLTNKKGKTRLQQKLNKIPIFCITKSDENNISILIPINNFEELSASELVNNFHENLVSLENIRHKFKSANPTFVLGGVDPTQETNDRRTILARKIFSLFKKPTTAYGKFKDAGLKYFKLENLEKVKKKTSIEDLLEKLTTDLIESTDITYMYTIRPDYDGTLSLYETASSLYEYESLLVDNSVNTPGRNYLKRKEPKGIVSTLFTQLYTLSEVCLGKMIPRLENEIPENPELEDPVIGKNIIPVFVNFKEAEDLLLTLYEEILEPFKKTRPISGFNKTFDVEFSDCLNTKVSVKNTDHFDDSYTLFNRVIPKGFKEERIQHRIKYRHIKPEKEKRSEYFGKNLPTEEIRKKQEKNLKSNYLIDEYTSPVDKIPAGENIRLLAESLKLEIIKMGLGDFLEFWNSNKLSNTELLFVPSTQDKDKSKVLKKEKSVDRFYEYQQQFHKKRKPTNYRFTITTSK